MKYILLGTLVLLFSVHLAAADIYITEIMHSPEMTDNDGEWIELYNDGDVAVDLSNWTVDGNDFDNATIGSGEYLIVARELLDGDDEDSDSFESYWGDNNGLWDESFSAVDGSFSLTGEDTITLTDGMSIEEVSYNSSYGGTGGKSIARVSVSEWEEGVVDGTPGSSDFSTATSSNGDVTVTLTVENSAPIISSIDFLTDDSSEDGVQVMPNVGLEKEVEIEIEVNDSNGYGDVSSLTVTVNEHNYSLSFRENLSSTVAVYEGSFSMNASDLAGDYSVLASVYDGNGVATSATTFSYLGILSTSVNVSSLSFSMEAGEEHSEVISLSNSGNVLVDTTVSAGALTADAGTISAAFVEVYSDAWFSLDESVPIALGLFPLDRADLAFRWTLPEDTPVGSYTGTLIIMSMEAG